MQRLCGCRGCVCLWCIAGGLFCRRSLIGLGFRVFGFLVVGGLMVALCLWFLGVGLLGGGWFVGDCGWFLAAGLGFSNLVV